MVLFCLYLQCLNVSQLLVNFGLNSVSKITPEQFTLLCPALLYQIDSRVCIQHYDDVAFGMAGSSLWSGNSGCFSQDLAQEGISDSPNLQYKLRVLCREVHTILHLPAGSHVASGVDFFIKRYLIFKTLHLIK